MSAHRNRTSSWHSLVGIIAVVVSILQPGFAMTAMADPPSPLQVTKTANPSPVTSGGQLTYTITMKNTGGARVDSVVMTDQVNGVGTIQGPPGLPQLTLTISQGTCAAGGANGNAITCQIGTIAGGATVTATIRGQVTAASGTTLNNTASVSGTKSAQNFTTNASVSVLVQGGQAPAADLTLNKTGPTSVAPLANMTYTLTVNNLGNANTSNVRVVDTLPAGVTLQAPTPFETTSLFTCSSNAPVNPITVVCMGGTVNAGQNATIKINAKAPAASGQITNTAIVDPDNTIPESNELNNTAAAVNTSVTTAPPTPALTIFKTDNNPTTYPWSAGAGPDPINPGQVLTYKIQVKNTATTRADDVLITDGTQALETASITVSQVINNGTVGNGGGCTVTGAQVRCLDRTLQPGGTITLTITGIVVVGAGATIFNTASVTGNIKNTGVSATASESTTIRPAVDLTITKSGPPTVCARSWPTTSNPAAQHLAKFPDIPHASGDIPGIGLLQPPVCLGGLTYHFVVGNSGQATASGVSIRDWLPAGVIFDSYQSSMPGLTCAVNSSNVITCNNGVVGPASLETIDILTVAPATLGTITNMVTVDPNNAIFEPDETNNDATTTTDVRTGIDLVVFKSDKKGVNPPGGAPPLTEGFDPIATNGTGTYTIIVDNVGTQDAVGIKVRDTLPAGTKFLSVQADQGFTCSHDGSATGGNVTCIGGHLRGTESEFYVPNGSAGPPIGDEFATIRIKFLATPFVQQQTGALMHNIVRVDPDNEIAEVNELNNLATDDTVVTVGDGDKGAFNQLTVDKTQVGPAANGAVATNGILIYNLHVENLGTDPVSNVVIQDYLPAGSRFISATDVTLAPPASAKFFCTHDGSATGGTITCTGGDFSGSINVIPPAPVPTARDIKVVAFAPNTPQTASNLTTVDPANVVPEGNEFDNDDQQDTDVRACNTLADCGTKNAVYELTIDKSQVSPPNNVARNAIVTYSLVVANLGSDPVSGIVVKDTLPQGARFIDARDTAASSPFAFQCSAPDSNHVVTCTGGALNGSNAALNIPGLATTTRTITMRVFAPDEPGSYPNVATVDPANAVPEGNEFNNTDSVVTEVRNGGNGPYVDLAVDKTQIAELDQDTPGGAGTPVRVDTGQIIHYLLHVTNGGAADAFQVAVRDIVPAGTTYFAAGDTAPGAGMFTCTFSAPNIDCSGGTILAGGFREINIYLVAPTHLDQIASDQGHIKQTITNQALVDPFNTIAEGDETNNSDSIQTIVESQINLKVVSKDGPSSANQNQEADYVITVKNEKTWGDGRIAFAAKVIDFLPVGLIPLSVDANVSNMACATQENPVNLVTCVGDLEPNQTVVITVHVFITAESGSLDNEACIDPDHQIDETSELDNCKTKTTEVEPPAAPNLNINKNASKGTVTAGETFTYTVTASNVGNATATGTVTVKDILPTEVTYQNATATNGFTCAQATGTVTCTGANLAAGQATVVTIEVKVNGGVTSSFTNTASVSGASQTKSASVTTNVGSASIDLVLSPIADTPDPANVGQNVSYTFTVTNGGTNASGAFDITAEMDNMTGLSFIGASASQGFTCGAIVGNIVTCSGAGLPASQLTTIKLTYQVTAGSPSTHELTVKADSGDAITETSEANNQQTQLTSITGALCTSCIDLVIGGILDTPDPISDGQTLTFISTASNAGDLPTTGSGPVVVRFSLPIGVDYVSSSANAGFTCVYTDPISLGILDYVDCSGDLLAGQGVVVTVTTTASDSERDLWLGSSTTTLSSNAEVDPGDAFPEGTGAGDEFTNANNGPIFESTTFPS